MRIAVHKTWFLFLVQNQAEKFLQTLKKLVLNDHHGHLQLSDYDSTINSEQLISKLYCLTSGHVLSHIFASTHCFLLIGKST